MSARMAGSHLYSRTLWLKQLNVLWWERMEARRVQARLEERQRLGGVGEEAIAFLGYTEDRVERNCIRVEHVP